MKKNKLITVLATIGCAALTVGAGLQVNTSVASAKEIGGKTISTFVMQNGADVRFKANDADYKNGIRFSAMISADEYNTLEALSTDVNYGMVIIPADIIAKEGYALTVENVFGANAVYCLEDSKTCPCENKIHVASVEYETLSDDPNNAGYKVIRGSLVDILPTNLHREFTALAYIECGSEYIFADYYENNQANNTRSMTYVAQVAIKNDQDDGATQEEGTLYKGYVAPLLSGEFAYTVNHYLPDLDEPIVEKAYGTLNSEVSATHITKSTLKENYSGYRIYGFTDESNTSSVLYANGKTVLNCYYEKLDTVLLDCSEDEIIADSQGNYWYLVGQNAKQFNTDEATNFKAEYLASQTFGEVTKTDVAKLTMNNADTYGAGHFYFGLDNNVYNKAESASWDYITINLCAQLSNAEGTVNTTAQTLNMYSWNMPIGSITTNEWVELKISKANLNALNGAKNRASIFSGSDTVPANKDTFDLKFENAFGWANGSGTKFMWTNSVNAKSSYPVVTYYIDSIEWGVDTQAPEIEVNDISKVYTGTFAPTITITDDTVPSLMYATGYTSPCVVTKNVYKLVGDVRAEEAITANEDGTWDISETGKYVLVVTADDRVYPEIAGNTAEKIVEFEAIVEPEKVTGQLTNFNIPYETSYLQAKTESNVTPEISYLASYEDANGVSKDGVAKYATSSVENQTYGAYFYLNFTDEMITEIWNAYSDANTNFTLTFSICVEMDKYIDYTWAPTNNYENSVYIVGKGWSDEFEGGVWTTLSFNEDQLASVFGWSTTSNTETTKDLNGTNYIFQMGYYSLTKTKTNVTYYIDSISYSTTTVEAAE